MPRYKFEGDSPRSLPEFAIESVAPGEVVDTGDQVLDHQDFMLVKEVKEKEAKSTESKASESKAESQAGAEAKATENKE